MVTTGSNVSMTNLVSNVGVVATDVTGVGTARSQLAACSDMVTIKASLVMVLLVVLFQ